ncbi:MAG: VWA domain-containing protein [Pirellulaceae bacterium]|nr:VWA domain-containing protein [Pirellulaceae bacterium]
MADWREQDDGPLDVRPPKMPDAGDSSAAKDQRWRSKLKPTVARSSAQTSTSSWKMSPEAEPPLSAGSAWKWTKVFLMSVLACGLTFLLIYELFFAPGKLPLHVLAVNKYQRILELFENPLAASQLKQIETINTRYISSNVFPEPAIDQQLHSLGEVDWKFQGTNPLEKLGDPVTAWYVNSYAKVTPEGIWLYHGQIEDLFADERALVDLKQVLENFVQAVAKKPHAYSWVILDLRLPSVAGGLGNMNPCWRTAATTVLERMDPQLRKRLIVTLPADDGQASWLAPEYSASFFGHHIFKLLDAPRRGAWYRRIWRGALSLEEFRNRLHDEVSTDVANHRVAIQTPVWLPAENLQEYQSMGLVAGNRAYYSSVAMEYGNQIEKLDQYWKKFSKYTSAFHWDPVGYAKVESQLLAMEELVLHSPGSFGAAAMRVDDALDKLYCPPVEMNVSLIEDDQRRDFYKHMSDSMMLSAPNAQLLDPDFWKKPDSEPPKPLELTAEVDKQRLVWQVYLNRAVAGGKERQDAFTKARLTDALRWVDPGLVEASSVAAGRVPIEIYLLQRMLIDIDWEANSENQQSWRPDACAQAIQTFDVLQRLGTQPDPEIDCWISTRIGQWEPEFLRSLDQLLAGQYQQADRELKKLHMSLGELHAQAETWAREAAASRELLYLAPHLLGWLLKESQITEDLTAVRQQLEELGVAFNQCLGIRQVLLQADARNSLTVESESLSKDQWLSARIERLKNAVRRYVQNDTGLKQTAAAARSPQTFRRNRIALECPLLEWRERVDLHDRVVAFLNSEAVVLGTTASASSNTGSAQPGESGREVMSVAQLFFDQIDDLKLPDIWKAGLGGDGRFALHAKLYDAQGREHLAKQDGLRMFSWLAGDMPSLRSSPLEPVTELLAGPRNRWAELEFERCCRQVERLAQAGWGNRKIPDASEKQWNYFYFGQLADQYLQALDRNPMQTKLSSAKAKVERQLGETVSNLQSLQVRIGQEHQRLPQEEQEMQVPIAVSGLPANSVAAVYLGTPGAVHQWHPQEPRRVEAFAPQPPAPSNGEALKSVEDLQVAGDRTKLLSTDHWKGKTKLPSCTLAWRGNYRSNELDWSSDSEVPIHIEFESQLNNNAVIRVEAADKPPLIDFALLLDCSGSMSEVIEVPLEGGGSAKRKIFDIVRDDVLRVLAELQRSHQKRDAVVRVGLMLFGLAAAQFENLDPADWQQFERSASTSATKKEGFGRFYATGFQELTEARRESLQQIISSLEPSTDTPLYDAILQACNLFKKYSSEGAQKVIYVFSDGANYVNTGSPYRQTSKHVEDEFKGASSKVALDIFHYDFFDKFSKNYQDKWKKEHVEGKKELENLDRASASVRYHESANHLRLANEVIERLPRATYEVQGNNSTASYSSTPIINGREFTVSQDSLPGRFVVIARRPSGTEITTSVALCGGEKIRLKLAGTDGDSRFDYPVFDPVSAAEKSGWRDVQPLQRQGAGFTSDAWWMNDFANPLRFKWAFRAKQSRDFTARPQFVLGLIEALPSGSLPGDVVPIADCSFLPDQHYPLLSLGPIPPLDPGYQKINVKLWVADSFPTELRPLPLQNEQYIDVPFDRERVRIRLSRSGSMVTAQVNYKAAPAVDRVFVVSRNIRQASRKYFPMHDEHTLTLSNGLADAEIFVITSDQLKQLVGKGTITQIELDGIPPRR